MKVKFVPQNIELEIAPNQTVKDLADKNNIFIKSVCNGLPSCAECRVRIVEGEHNVLPPSTKELSLIGTGHFIDQRRLSCQLRCFGDVTIDLSEQIEKQKQQVARRPQGSRKSEQEVSHAVAGNLLEQDSVLKELAQQSLERKEPQADRGRDRQADRGPDRRPHGHGHGRGNGQKRRHRRGR